LTPAVCVIVAYAFFGLDVVGDELEMPFGNDPNDLPLDAISRMIEINLRQRLGETDLPLPLKPVDEILS
jgi:putative membrane protein